MHPFAYKVYQQIIKSKLISPQEKILISVSGGIDSISLACLLKALETKLNLELHIVHFHHGLRKESDEEELFVKEFASQLHIPFYIFRHHNLKNIPDLQNQARLWRYQKLEELRQELNFTSIALGHHLNDLIETQIWRILRGCSLFNLNPIKLRQGIFIRPLLHTEKQDLMHYLQNIGQSWKEDSSNQETKYTRNTIRHQLIPLMQKCANYNFSEKMLALAQDAEKLNLLFENTLTLNLSEYNVLNYSDITSLPDLLAAELIHRFLVQHHQQEIKRNQINQILKLVKANQRNWKLTLNQGNILHGKDQQIWLEVKS